MGRIGRCCSHNTSKENNCDVYVAGNEQKGTGDRKEMKKKPFMLLISESVLQSGKRYPLFPHAEFISVFHPGSFPCAS